MIIILLIAVTGFEYMLVDPIAQRVGMGYGLGGDGHSVHYNPAGLAYTIETQYSVSYFNYIAETHFGFLGFEHKQIGLGIRYFYSGRMKKTDIQGNEYGSFGTHFIDLNIGKGFFYKNIGVGGSVKGVYENIDSLFSFGGGLDFGVLYILTEKSVQIGCAIKNLGYSIIPFIEEESFPYEIDVGVVKRFPQGWVGLDIVKPTFTNLGARLGGEYSLNPIFILRISYNTMLSSMRTGESGLDFLTGVTVGFAIRKGALQINYAYAPYFVLGNGHRITINIGG